MQQKYHKATLEDLVPAGHFLRKLEYEEQQDVYLCPNGKELRRKRLYRSGSGLFWEYWADKKDCSSLSFAAKVFKRDGQGWCQKSPGQLLQRNGFANTSCLGLGTLVFLLRMGGQGYEKSSMVFDAIRIP